MDNPYDIAATVLFAAGVFLMWSNWEGRPDWLRRDEPTFCDGCYRFSRGIFCPYCTEEK